MLKIANPAFNATELEAQDVAADLHRRGGAVTAHRRAAAQRGGRKVHGDNGIAGQAPPTCGCCGSCPAALCTSPAICRRLLSRGWARWPVASAVRWPAFDHPGLDRALQWDLRYGADVVAELISHVGDPSQRARVEEAAAAAWSRIEPLADELPLQAAHLDLTDANVVVSRGAGGAVHPDGVIDFGDLSHSWAVSELAITVSSVLGHPGTDPTSILPGVRAFHAIRPLDRRRRREALWPMLVLRTAVLIVSGAQQAALDPDNAYVTEQTEGEMRMFEQATSVPVDVMTALIKAELGLGGDPQRRRGRCHPHRWARSLERGDPGPVCAVRRL